MISPWLIIFLVMTMFPMGYGLYLSFTNYLGFNVNHLRWVGFLNYQTVFTDTDALSSMRRTVVLTLVTLPLNTVVTLFLALLLNRETRGVNVFRTIYYLPAILPVISIVLMWRSMFTQDGILNTVLGFFQIHPVNWFAYDSILGIPYAQIALTLMGLWSTGASLLITLAGLKAIPKEMYEAAAIDGATNWQRLIRITVPLLTPVLFFNMLTGIINGLQVYLQPILLTTSPGNGLLSRPKEPIYLYAVHAFQQIFANQRFAYGMALLWVSFVVTLALSIIVFKTSRYWVHYEMDQEGKVS